MSRGGSSAAGNVAQNVLVLDGAGPEQGGVCLSFGRFCFREGEVPPKWEKPRACGRGGISAFLQLLRPPVVA